MSRNLVFGAIGFLILAAIVGVIGIIYLNGDNDDNEEILTTEAPPQSATATMTIEANQPEVTVATPTATLTEAQLMNTEIPLTNTAIYEDYVETMEALDQMATATQEAIATAGSNP